MIMTTGLPIGNRGAAAAADGDGRDGRVHLELHNSNNDANNNNSSSSNNNTNATTTTTNNNNNNNSSSL